VFVPDEEQVEFLLRAPHTRNCLSQAILFRTVDVVDQLLDEWVRLP
jgi:hypothetical protein